jgi:hypothetical protein
MMRFGLFWKAQKGLLMALEYHRLGDKRAVEATVHHKVSANTVVGSTLIYDVDYKKFLTKTALS